MCETGVWKVHQVTPHNFFVSFSILRFLGHFTKEAQYKYMYFVIFIIVGLNLNNYIIIISLVILYS